jgi:hypothetical protein
VVFNQFTLCTYGESEGINHPGEIPLDWFLLRMMMVVAKNRNLLLTMDSTP